MSESLTKPRVWTDFDGTAVALAPKISLRNALKYPLDVMPGYIEFLRGVQLGGADVAGIISRRPDIAPRRWATQRSIAKLGLAKHLGEHKQMVLAGSEKAKGLVLVEQSKQGQIAMVEDKPHKLGSVLVDSLIQVAEKADEFHSSIVLGAVAHPRTNEYMDRFYAYVAELKDVDVYDTSDHSFAIDGGNFYIEALPLEPYSLEAGLSFANFLSDVSQ